MTPLNLHYSSHSRYIPTNYFRIKICWLLMLAFMSVSNIVLAGDDRVIHTIDFSNVQEGDAQKWLINQGYVLKLDAESLDMQFKNNRLEIETEEEIAGLVVLKLKETNWLPDVSRIDIEWGVTRHPEGANWEQGYNKVSIALMFFFGEEKVNSGLPFGINSAPYFISPFIGNREVDGKTYTGNLYKKGGRYVCVAVTQGGGELIKSSLKIDPRFLNEFNKEAIPAITGIAFQMNTQDTESGAKSFIKKITFISNK